MTSEPVVDKQERLQIYAASNSGVSPFWREKYERDAKKYWDVFYKRHQDKFFKDRHYLDKEWGQYFSGHGGKKVILEIGAGAGNTVFPLIATYPDIFIHACDFSQRAVNLIKSHADFMENRISAFVCDLTIDNLSKHIPPASVDIVTMIFVLSAVSPEKMSLVLQNIKRVLKPNGHVLFRDYAVGDLAQERLIGKDQKISDNFYVRGDGTRAFYFSNDFLTSLFKENGFDVEELGLCCKQVENRSRELVMNRRWLQAVFCFTDGKLDQFAKTNNVDPEIQEAMNDFDGDMSEGVVAFEMFGISQSDKEEIIEVKLQNYDFKFKVLSKEYQHTCKATGLMLWESARLMACVLERNPSIVSGKSVLELGCGATGICSMVAAGSANLVCATDGDINAYELLTQNITSNIQPPLSTKLTAKILEWGNKDHIEAIRSANGNAGFDVIIGTDVTYVADAIVPLFSTAKQLISSKGDTRAFILCHIFRRVDEPSLLSAASRFGFKLVDKWPHGSSSGSLISSWFSDDASDYIPNSALNIMYFTIEGNLM